MTSLILGFFLACAPKIGPLQGQIVNSQQVPLKDVHIKLEGTDLASYTNDQGRFELSAEIDDTTPTPTGQQSILISRPGYEPIRKKIPRSIGRYRIEKPIELKALTIKVPYRRKNLDLYAPTENEQSQ